MNACLIMFGIFHYPGASIPLVIEVSDEQNFIPLCENFNVEWAHLMYKDSGIIIDTYHKNV